MPTLDQFYEISVPLTGYEKVDLQGTGLGPVYLDFLIGAVGSAVLERLFAAWEQVNKKAPKKPDQLNQLIRNEIMSQPEIGPVARNIVKMWYMGNWYPLPVDWENNYAQSPAQTVVISTAAYKEGFVWKAMGRHPKGAKSPGWASWESAPNHLEDIF